MRLSEKELRLKRAIYVQQRLKGVKNRYPVILRLSEELFISIFTIYKDLKRVI